MSSLETVSIDSTDRADAHSANRFISEVVAGHLARSLPTPLTKSERTGILPLDWLKTNKKAVKLALYGFFLSAPLGHTLLGKTNPA